MKNSKSLFIRFIVLSAGNSVRDSTSMAPDSLIFSSFKPQTLPSSQITPIQIALSPEHDATEALFQLDNAILLTREFLKSTRISDSGLEEEARTCANKLTMIVMVRGGGRVFGAIMRWVVVVAH
ncbi:hypothetical protein U1Q18_008345 [Sarracenia purpurea var. burkii]